MWSIMEAGQAQFTEQPGWSLSLSLCLDHWPACLPCSKSGHYWWCLPAWSFISMSNISCPANCNYVWNFLQCFLQEKNVLWIVVNVFELSFCNKLNGSNVKMWYAAQCLRFWLEVVAKVVTKGKQNSFWSKPRKCNNTLDRWPRRKVFLHPLIFPSFFQVFEPQKCNNTLDRWPQRKVFFASPLIFPIFDFWFFQFLIKTSEVQ